MITEDLLHDQLTSRLPGKGRAETKYLVELFPTVATTLVRRCKEIFHEVKHQDFL